MLFAWIFLFSFYPFLSTFLDSVNPSLPGFFLFPSLSLLPSLTLLSHDSYSNLASFWREKTEKEENLKLQLAKTGNSQKIVREGTVVGTERRAT